MDLGEKGGGVELLEVERNEGVVQMYFMREESIHTLMCIYFFKNIFIWVDYNIII